MSTGLGEIAVLSQAGAPVSSMMVSSGASHVAVGAASKAALAAAGKAVVTTAVAAGTVIAVGVAAVLVTRAAMVAAGQAADGIIQLNAMLDDAERKYREATEVADCWQIAAAEVNFRNGELRRLRVRAGRVGGDGPDLPPPFSIAGKCLTDVRDWCRRTDAALLAAAEHLRRASAESARRRLAADLSGASAADGSARNVMELLDRYAASLDEPAKDPAVSPAMASTMDAQQAAVVQRELDAICDGLIDELDTEDFQRVLQMAANVRAARNAFEAQPRLNMFRERVRVLRQKARRDAEDLHFASRAVDALRQPAFADAFTPDQRQIIVRLEAVAEGRADLHDELRRQTQALYQVAADLAAEAALREQIKQMWESLGYDVEAHFDTLNLHRKEWDGEHHATVSLDTKEMSTALVRHIEITTDGIAQTEEVRCKKLGDDTEKVAELYRLSGGRMGKVTKAGVEEILFGEPKEQTTSGQSTSTTQPQEQSRPNPREGS